MKKDVQPGWRLLGTKEHRDKVRYGDVDDFWHSELASDPDNQNKELIRRVREPNPAPAMQSVVTTSLATTHCS